MVLPESMNKISPGALASHLRKMAAAIDASSAPSKSRVASELKRVLVALDTPGMESDLKAKEELRKKTEKVLENTTDNLGKKMEDLVEKGVAGEDITKAVGEMERDFKELERKSRMR